MLTRTAIRNLTHASFYERGVALYEEDQVKNIRVREESFTDYISAQVAGSGTKMYHVSAAYDRAGARVVREHCDCPAYQSYDGLCKHIVAVLLKYTEQKNADGQLSFSLPEEGGELLTESFGSFGETEKATSPSMRELLNRAMARKTAPLRQDNGSGKVRLEPELVCTRVHCRVEFRIGCTQMYVLKDIFAFAKRFEGAEEFSYGKKLKFIHTPEAFEPESRALLQFLRNWALAHENRFRQPPYYLFGNQSGAASAVREIELKGRSLERFLEAVGENPFLAAVERQGGAFSEAALTEWRRAEGRPERSLTLKGVKEGLEIFTKEPFFCAGDQYLYSFQRGQIFRETREELAAVTEFQNCFEGEEKLFLRKEDIPAFLREILPQLKPYYECVREEFKEEDYHVEEASYEIYLDAVGDASITCRLIAVYGERRYNVYGDQADMGLRDYTRELLTGKAVAAYFNHFSEQSKMMMVMEDEDAMYTLLTEGVPRLQELGEVYISDALKRIKIYPAPKVSVGISLSGNLLELSMLSEDVSREELWEILSKYDRRKKYFRLKNGEFINIAGEGIENLIEVSQSLGLTKKNVSQDKIALPGFRAMFLDAQLKEQAGLGVTKNRAFKSMIRNMKTVEDNDFEVPQGLSGTLREYQKKGFLWLKTLQHNGFGGILADDMGLGKTLQVIAFLSSCAEEAAGEGKGENGRSLIVTPASLVYNWYSEIGRFAPGLSARMILGTAAERKALIESAGEQEILITSYDLLKRDLPLYEGMQFFCQVIDEAQFIKNHSTQAAKAVKEIQAECKFALTGTPVENRLSELWSIFDYLMPGFLFSYQRFREQLEIPIVQGQDEKAVRRLQKMIAPFVLRRLKKDVLKDLPDKLEKEMVACLLGEQQKLYDAHVKRLSYMVDGKSDEEFAKSKLQILAELTRLRQLCCDPALLYEGYEGGSAKTQMCLELIRNAVSGGHKLLLFSQFTSMLEILTDRLKEEGISYYVLTGATKKEERRDLVERFNRDETSVFCISLKAGGTGLNLTAADIVIHYDPWWNLAVQNQATDRAHRIGQKNMVTVYKLVTKGTIEENILKLQEKKRELADGILSGEGVGSGRLTRQELREIVGLME